MSQPYVVEVRVRRGKRVHGKATLETFSGQDSFDKALLFAQFVSDKISFSQPKVKQC